MLFAKVYTHIHWIQEKLLAAETTVKTVLKQFIATHSIYVRLVNAFECIQAEAEWILKGRHASISSITAEISSAPSNATARTQHKGADCTNSRKLNSKSPSALEISNSRGAPPSM